MGFLDSLIESLPAMVFVKEAKSLRFVRLNKAGEELLGFSRQDLLGKGDYDFFPKEQADDFVARDRAVLAGRKAVDIPEESIQTRYRGVRILHTKKIPLLGRDGEAEYLLGLSEDITDRKTEYDIRQKFLAEAGLRLTSSLDYRVTLREIAKLAVPTLADWCVVMVTREDESLERVGAFHREEKLIPLVEELGNYYPTHDRANEVSEVIRSGQSQLIERVEPQQLADVSQNARHLELLREVGMLSCLIVPIPGRGRNHGAITLIQGHSGRMFRTDDLRLAEELGRRAGIAIENALLYEEARDAIRTRDEFLSIASHELKTPITALKLHTELNRRKLDGTLPSKRLDETALRRVLETTDQYVDRLVRLIDDLLDLSRITSAKLAIHPGKVDLGALVGEVMERFGNQVAQSGSLCQLRVEDGVVGYWDRYRLEQVIGNLVTNAIKYGARSTIEVSVLREGESALIRVRDEGIGISPENLGKLFHRFERASAPRDTVGLGLGLYISRQIVEAHGGSIHAESKQGGGSTFTVRLPLGDSARSAAETPKSCEIQ